MKIGVERAGKRLGVSAVGKDDQVHLGWQPRQVGLISQQHLKGDARLNESDLGDVEIESAGGLERIEVRVAVVNRGRLVPRLLAQIEVRGNAGVAGLPGACTINVSPYA